MAAKPAIPASNSPLHLVLQPNSPRSKVASSNLPAPGGHYVLPALSYQTGPPGGILIAGDTLTRFSASSPPPAAGQRLIQAFTAQVTMSLSLDGGATFTEASGTASAQMLVTPSGTSWGGVNFYDA